MNKIVLKIEGMHCAACMATVEKAIGKLSGVDSVSVNLTAGNALIYFDSEIIDINEIIKATENAGYKAYMPESLSESEASKKAVSDSKKAKDRLILSLIAAIPLFYISMGHMLGAPIPLSIDPVNNAIGYALSQLFFCIIVIISGSDIYKSAFKSAAHKNVNMDTLITMGSLSSFLFSIYSTGEIISGKHEYVHQLYFESAGLILTFILIGRFLEASSKRKTNSAVEKLLNLSPSTAIKVIGNELKEVPTGSLMKGDIVAVKSGTTVPVDGKIIKGNCFVDESMLTGESMPVEKSISSDVFGGTINKNGYIEYTVTEEVNNSAPARIAKYVNSAQTTKAPIANTANKVASVFVPIVIAIAFISGLSWLVATKDFYFALRIFVCVLVIACPCSLGLATPTALTVAMGSSASKGILIKNGESLQRLERIDTIIFDKTGTITNGNPDVTDIKYFGDDEDCLKYLYSAEIKSEHLLASAVCDYCKRANIEPYEATGTEFITGKGVFCTANDQKVICGNINFLKENGVDMSAACEYHAENSKSGKTVIYLSVNNSLKAGISISDSIRTECIDTIKQLNSMGIDTIMLTGDNEITAKEIAEKTGIMRYYAELLPDDKLKKINELNQNGCKTVMVGDGINDAPALVAADVGIAIGSGTDIAIESADIVLVGGDISKISLSLKISKKTMKIIRQNLFWAFMYNIICIPVAAGLLYLFNGPLLNPMIAAAAMSLSSITVVSNSLRLKNFY